jgi:hypothetical protein
VPARVVLVLSLDFLQERDVGLQQVQLVADAVQHQAAVELAQPLWML